MIETAVNPANSDAVEAVLRDELSRGDVSAQTVVPILRHLLANDGNSMFSDEVIARVRGMAQDLVEQLCDGVAANMETADALDEGFRPELTEALFENPALVGHLHAGALEWQLTERIHSRHGLDPVLSPLLQAHIASPDSEISALGMKFLASQARFVQSQRRMQLPIAELPGDLLHSVLMALRAVAGESGETNEAAAAVETAIRVNYEEPSTRLGMASRLISAMGGDAVNALSITHAGAALFLSALSIGSGQDRDAAVLSTNDSFLARFALALRATGMKVANIEQQFLAIHPDVALPDGFELIGPDRAASILADSGKLRGG